ncbi:uncharacterized protein zgc:113276 [Clupea harengus]|uniref:Uncharacterized protein zgc:113276 n=1 Tax=Clupea harengus TaxID=7950 RepID=A0A6P3VL77_CLUHA|nr:uncharacterized protein zgc:113276 [Clupea harengus]XP_031414777.1 uncharacterized protein zgc:113276 [Clupea harengus]
MLDVLIIGGGPHALTLATLLTHPNHPVPPPGTDILDGVQLSTTKSRPGRTRSKRRLPAKPGVDELAGVERVSCPPLQLCAVDAYGQWTSLWESQFKALNIPHLRSHTLVHTDPLNKRALQEFVVGNARENELHGLPERVYIQDENAFFNDNRLGKRDKKLLNSSGVGHQKSLCFSLPGTQLSVDFFREQVHKYNLDSVLVKGTVDRIIPVLSGKEVLYFRILMQNGDTLEAERVVMATGPTRAQMANIPAWVLAIGESYPEESLQHTVQLMHHLALLRQPQTEGPTQEGTCPSTTGPPCVCQPGQRLLVIGGGLSSAHIISMALHQGASHITWVMRKHLQLKQFDVGDVESLIGRYSHVEHGIKMDGLAYLRQFYNERSLHKRLAMIQRARKGGAVTPEAYAQLQPFIQSGRLSIKAYCQVSQAKWCYQSQMWKLALSCGDHWTGDKIWLSTGCKLDVKQDPMLSDIMKEFPIQVIDGWPCILENLQWDAGCPLYVMGQYAALQIGPHAVNLAGGQAASFRIARDILSHHSGKGQTKTTPLKKEKALTDDYIMNMHGLMWL